MKVDEAIKVLRQRGIIVCHLLRGGYRVRYPTSTRDDTYTARELIRYARYFRGGQLNTGGLKEETHSKNRAATQQSLAHQRYEDFYHTKMRATGNVWNWD